MSGSYLLRVAPFAALLACGAAFAQGAADFPSRAVTVVAAIAPGGGIDVEARMYTNKLIQQTGQSFVLDFKPGASGTIGGAYVAKAKPDGYTVHVVSAGFTVYPAFYRDLSFDIIKDFAPLSQMNERMSVLQVSNKLPVKNFQEFVAYAKANPGKINYGTSGNGSIVHLAGAWLADAAGIKFTFVPFKGSGPLILELMAGRIDASSGILSLALPYVTSGKTRALGVLNNKRTKMLPGLPTLDEMGITGYNYSNWLGFLAPAATPAPVVTRLNELLVKAARDPEIIAILEKDGSAAVGNTPAQFRAVLIAESARWKKIVDDTGIRLDE